MFLISIGLRLDLGALAAAPVLVVGAALALIGLKAALTFGLARLFRVRSPAALQSALMLAPGGEFGFVILGVASGLGLLPPVLTGEIFLLTALTMATIPALSWLGRQIAPQPKAAVAAELLPVSDPDANGVIIAGFGRVGRTVARLLRAHDIPWVALDTDVSRVAERRGAGDAVFYGDSTQAELLRRVGLATARALVVTIDQRERADMIVSAARAERPDLLIVARARDSRACRPSLRDGRDRRGAGDGRGEPAALRSGAGRSRHPDGPGARLDPRAAGRVPGRDQADGAGQPGARARRAAAPARRRGRGADRLRLIAAAVASIGDSNTGGS